MKLNKNYIVFDFETGGLDASVNAITELAFIVLDGETLNEIERYSSFVLPYNKRYDDQALQFTGISMEMLKNGQPLKKVLEDFKNCCEKNKTPKAGIKGFPLLVGHNVEFDIDFLFTACVEQNVDLSKSLTTKSIYGLQKPVAIDTLEDCIRLWPGEKKHTLTHCVERAKIEKVGDAHRALDDVLSNVELFRYLTFKLRQESNYESNIEKSRLHFKF